MSIYLDWFLIVRLVTGYIMEKSTCPACHSLAIPLPTKGVLDGSMHFSNQRKNRVALAIRER